MFVRGSLCFPLAERPGSGLVPGNAVRQFSAFISGTQKQKQAIRDAVLKHVARDARGVGKCDTPGGMQELTVVNEWKRKKS